MSDAIANPNTGTQRPVGFRELSGEQREQFASLSARAHENLRYQAISSLYFLCSWVLGYKLNEHTHGPICAFIDNERSNRRLLLYPRSHYKSTVATIGDGVRQGLRDPDNARVLVVNEQELKAQDFVEEITGHFERNEMLQLLFPELIHKRFTGPGIAWGKTGASLPRKTSWKENTWTAAGVKSGITGRHFTHIKADDLIGMEAKLSPAEMQRVMTWNGNVEALLIGEQDQIDWIGTRWALHDIYAVLQEKFGTDLAVLTRGAIENGKPIFPEKFSMIMYSRMMQNEPDVWQAQYENNPLDTANAEWPQGYRYFEFNGDFIEYRTRSGKPVRVAIRDMDRITLVDTAIGEKTTNCKSAISTVGVLPEIEGERNVAWLEAWNARVNPDALVDLSISKARSWQSRVLGVEEVALTTTLFYINKKLREQRLFVNVLPNKPKRRPKDDRIRGAFGPLLRNRELLLHPSMTEQRVKIRTWPNVQDKDDLDAFAYYVDHAIEASSSAEVEEDRKAAATVNEMRNAWTGYS